MIVYCYFTIYALVFDLTLIALIGVSGASKTTIGFGLKLLAYKRTFSASPTQHNTQQDYWNKGKFNFDDYNCLKLY